MKLSTRVRYAVRAMVELAKHPPNKPVALREIAAQQEISAKYLEQMLAMLKVAGLIDSVRGAEGGYRLARPPESITVWDVYTTLENADTVVDCGAGPCPRQPICAVRELWDQLARNIAQTLKQRTIKDLAQRETRLQKQHHS